MSRRGIGTFIALALIAGGITVNLVPEPAMLAVVLPPFLLCIVFGWVLTIQNRGLNLGPSGIFLPIKPFTRVRASRSLMGFALSAAFSAGACLGLLLMAAYG